MGQTETRREGDVRPIEVELVEHTPGAPHSGIGRYTQELYRRLADRISVQLTTQIDPSLIRYSSFFHNLPLGIRARRPGSIVHFVEDLGSSQMLWNPVIPAVATSHDLGMLVWPPEATMHRPLDRFIWYLSYLALRRMDAVITVSEFSRRMVIEHLNIPPSRVFAIHSGIDTGRFRPIPDARERLTSRYALPHGSQDRYLLYVGTEIPRKNLKTIFQTLERLPPNVRLLKAGAAGHPRFREATLRAIDASGVNDRVILLDDISDEELALAYSAADVYICCSMLEGFGLPILEAMASGTPVVCSDVTSLPEIAGDAAILVPPEDDQGFAAAVASILDDEGLRSRAVTLGLERARHFSWDKTANEVVSVYERVLDARAGRYRFE